MASPHCGSACGFLGYYYVTTEIHIDHSHMVELLYEFANVFSNNVGL
jgi:hypothetical protein